MRVSMSVTANRTGSPRLARALKPLRRALRTGQFYRPDLSPIGHNIRLSRFTWDPQLNAPKRFCVCGSDTFIGDYFGLDFGGGYAYTTSISTYDYGQNPSNYQQQIVARVLSP
jgi:hypothetical protein